MRRERERERENGDVPLRGFNSGFEGDTRAAAAVRDTSSPELSNSSLGETSIARGCIANVPRVPILRATLRALTRDAKNEAEAKPTREPTRGIANYFRAVQATPRQRGAIPPVFGSQELHYSRVDNIQTLLGGARRRERERETEPGASRVPSLGAPENQHRECISN